MDSLIAVENREQLKEGVYLEVKDLTSDTWIDGLLLECNEHERDAGISILILRADGSTIMIDCCSAEVYFSTDERKKFFAQMLDRSLHETTWRAQQISRGLSLLQ